MIIDYEKIDHESEFAQKNFKRAVDNFRQDCLKSIVSMQARQKGGRVLRREIQRKNVDEETIEEGNKLTMIFSSKGRTIGKLIVEFENAPNYIKQPVTEEEDHG